MWKARKPSKQHTLNCFSSQSHLIIALLFYRYRWCIILKMLMCQGVEKNQLNKRRVLVNTVINLWLYKALWTSWPPSRLSAYERFCSVNVFNPYMSWNMSGVCKLYRGNLLLSLSLHMYTKRIGLYLVLAHRMVWCRELKTKFTKLSEARLVL
jgi:hypothetical protein